MSGLPNSKSQARRYAAMDEDDGPHTSVPNRLLALLVGADHCEHAADHCCHDCMTRAMDYGLALLESPAAQADLTDLP